MLLTVIIVVTILGPVVSKFDESHNVLNEVFKRGIIDVNKCEDTKQWSQVANQNQGLTTSYIGSESVLLSPGNLELYVHVITSSKANFLLTLSNSDGDGTASYIYNGSRQESESGWCKLSFPTHNTGLNYINLLGYSDDSENVLIDSFYYKPNIYVIKQNHGDKVIIVYIHDHEVSKSDAAVSEVLKGIENGIMNFLNNEYSELDYTAIRDGTENDVNSQDDGGRLLGIWVIVLIVVAAATVISLVAVVAYQLGLSRGIDKNPSYIEDVEPARVVVIPRVRGVTDSPIGDFM